MRLIDADEVVKFYKNMGKEFPELSVGVHFSINDIINNLDNIDTVKNVHLGGKTVMNKYNEVEVKTAQNLLKEGYKWIVRNKYGRLYALSEKPIKSNNNLWVTTGNAMYVCRFVPIFQSIRYDDKEPVSLENIVHPQILDDAEKKYLSAVIKPFRDRVRHIKKVRFISDESEYQYIVIILRDVSYNIALPIFKADTMYKGMEINRKYTLEELGL